MPAGTSKSLLRSGICAGTPALHRAIETSFFVEHACNAHARPDVEPRQMRSVPRGGIN
jgi:hypothetical protein